MKPAGRRSSPVGTKQIKDGQVLTKDIGDGHVAPADLPANAVDGSKVADESLKAADLDESTLFNNNSLNGEDVDESTLFNNNSINGADIDESSLQGVDAAEVGGGPICRTNGVIDVPMGAATPICAVGPFTVSADCNAFTMVAGVRLLIDNTSANDSFYVDSTPTNDSDFDSGEQQTIGVLDSNSAGPTVGSARFHVAAPAGGPQLAGDVTARALFVSTLVGTCELGLVSFG